MPDPATPTEALLQRIADRLDDISDQLEQAPRPAAKRDKETSTGAGATVPVDGR